MNHLDDFTAEWRHRYDGGISNFRITRGKSLYRLPWWRRLLTPWRWWRFRRPTEPFPMTPAIPASQVVQAVKSSVASGLKPGWHTATITFKLDKDGDLVQLDQYKVSCFGEDKP
jgi:hypothetical protein